MSTLQFPHRGGFFRSSPLKPPPLLFQRYTPWCPPIYGLPSLLGTFEDAWSLATFCNFLLA